MTIEVRSSESLGAKKQLEVVRRSLSASQTINASRALGRELTLELVGNYSLDPSAKILVCVKQRDGAFAFQGMTEILTRCEPFFVKTRRYGRSNENVEIVPLSTLPKTNSSRCVVVDPMSARGTTASAITDFLQHNFRVKQLFVLHFITTKLAISTVQLKLDQYLLHGYIQAGEIHDRVDGRGWIWPGLDWIKDYGDKVFGTWGQDMTNEEIRNYVRELVNSETIAYAGLKGVILYLLLRLQAGTLNISKDERPLPTFVWICNMIRYLETIARVTLVSDWQDRNAASYFRSEIIREALGELMYDGFVRRVEDRYRLYNLTEEGSKYSLDIYVPTLAELEPYRTVIRPLADVLIAEQLLRKKPWVIYNEVKSLLA